MCFVSAYGSSDDTSIVRAFPSSLPAQTFTKSPSDLPTLTNADGVCLHRVSQYTVCDGMRTHATLHSPLVDRAHVSWNVA